jgi:hypothetical protein
MRLLSVNREHSPPALFLLLISLFLLSAHARVDAGDGTTERTIGADDLPQWDADPDQYGPQSSAVAKENYSAIYYVSVSTGRDEGPGNPDEPFRTISSALKHIDVIEVSSPVALLVAEGRYEAKGLQLQPGLHLYGGFKSGDWDNREIFLHQAILDADQSDTAVVIGSDNSLIDGFVITGARHAGMGGGIHCDHASPMIKNNFIHRNRTVYLSTIQPETLHIRGHEGGGIAVHNAGNPVIRNNLIVANSTDVGDGGAIAVHGSGTNPLIEKNVIMHNESGLTDSTLYDGNRGSRSSNGAAISVSSDARPAIRDNLILLNRAHFTNDSGGIYVDYGGAPVIRGNWLVGNTTSDDGGAVYIRGKEGLKPAEHPTVIESNIFSGNRLSNRWRRKNQWAEAIWLSKQGRAIIRNNLFMGQHGGIGNANSQMDVVNNTIVDNDGAGIAVDLRKGFGFVPLSTVTGNILWGNGIQFEIRQTVNTPPDLVGNIIQGGYGKDQNLDRNPGLIQDRLEGTIAGRSYDQYRFRTTLETTDLIKAPNLAGRVIQIGEQAAVIHASGPRKLVIWGRVTDPSLRFQVFNSGRIGRARGLNIHGFKLKFPINAL